jgi:hypothetical protein
MGTKKIFEEIVLSYEPDQFDKQKRKEWQEYAIASMIICRWTLDL